MVFQGNGPWSRDFPGSQFLLSCFAIPGGLVSSTQLSQGCGDFRYFINMKGNEVEDMAHSAFPFSTLKTGTHQS